MGFSTSGSFLIIVTGFFLALGTLYTATANTAEQRQDALEDQRERDSAVRESAIDVVSVTYDGTANELEILVNNTGEKTLSVEETDVLVDGRWVPIAAFDTATVDGAETDVWLPGQQLRLVQGDRTAAPDRVKLVTGVGVAATGEVS